MPRRVRAGKPRKRAICEAGHEMLSTPIYRIDEWIREYCTELGCGYGHCKQPLAEIRVDA